ncbi:MAG: hypothetical protein R3B97_15455 [Dehalococcoidia bacterium]
MSGRAWPSALSPAVFVGANAIDYFRAILIAARSSTALEEVLRLGSKLGSFYGVRIRIEAPIIHL